MEGSRTKARAGFWSFLHGSRFHFSMGQVVLLVMAAMILGAILRPIGTAGSVGTEGVAALIGLVVIVGVILSRAHVKEEVD